MAVLFPQRIRLFHAIFMNTKKGTTGGNRTFDDPTHAFSTVGGSNVEDSRRTFSELYCVCVSVCVSTCVSMSMCVCMREIIVRTLSLGNNDEICVGVVTQSTSHTHTYTHSIIYGSR